VERITVAFAPSDEQLELLRITRRFLDDKVPLAQVRRLMETPDGFDLAVWEQMGKESALQALHIPEAYGGMGFSFFELGLVFEEMGRALLGGPYLSSIGMGANAVLAAGTHEQCDELLPGIADGRTRACLAIAEQAADAADAAAVAGAGTPAAGIWDPVSITTSARAGDDGHLLHGAKTTVVDGHSANLVIVVAREPGTSGPDGVGMYAVDATAAVPGLTRTPLPTLDQTRKLARLEFDGVPARRLDGPDSGWTAVRRTLSRAAVCLAAEQVGGAARCLEMAVDYAKTRSQFGRPIGGFQAIKHRCADLVLAVETARSAAYHAIAAAADDSSTEAEAASDEPDPMPGGGLEMAASLALAHCSEVFARAAGDNVQIHGGVGFTWEHDAHLFLKRAKSSQYLLGRPSLHRELVADLMGL
jgi:alkylation response protein AidB-like acyl-CoA dehydrogenase